MKKIGWGLLLTLMTLTALAQDKIERRSNGLLRFIARHQLTRNIGLYTIMAQRCSRYMNYPDGLLCKTTVARQLKLLDHDLMVVDKKIQREGFVFVAFKKNLLQLLKQRETEQYLASLQQRLNHHLLGEEQVNIWEFTLKHYGTRYKAAQVIAALFQDTSLAKLHLAYLQQSRATRGEIGSNLHQNQELLSRIINTINLILDYQEDSYQELFYPREVRGELNRNLYHFYVPLYLAMALRHEGYNSIFAVAAPLMMTLSYEFITGASDYRYLLQDPSHLDPTKDDHKIRDIFGGFSGARFGAQESIPQELFPRLKASFGRSTTEAVQLLLH